MELECAKSFIFLFPIQMKNPHLLLLQSSEIKEFMAANYFGLSQSAKDHYYCLVANPTNDDLQKKVCVSFLSVIPKLTMHFLPWLCSSFYFLN